MKVSIAFFLLFGLAVLGCHNDIRTIHQHDKPVAKGEFLKMEQLHRYGDTIVFDTHGEMSVYQTYDSISMVPDVYKAFNGVKIGDTVDYDLVIDSTLTVRGHKYIFNGNKLHVTAVVLDILPDRESLAADIEVTRRILEQKRR